MLEINNSTLVVVDVQGKLARLMHDREGLYKNIRILIQAARSLDIPVIWCQQVPDALGPTVGEIAELLDGIEPVNKASFSCCGNEAFSSAVNVLDRNQVVVCGIETHVCVWQTAADLHRKGYEICVPADAVSSRSAANKQIALDRLRTEGVAVSCVEMILFEWLRTAEHEKFREVARLIR